MPCLPRTLRRTFGAGEEILRPRFPKKSAPAARPPDLAWAEKARRAFPEFPQFGDFFNSNA